MRRESQFRLSGRPRRLPLRFEALEDRLQPNDMLGLGLSLLTPWSVADLGAAADQAPPALTEVGPDVGLVAENQPAAPASFEIPVTSPVAPVAVQPSAPAVEVQGVDQVFDLVNAQPTAIEGAFPQGPAARSQLVDLIRGLGTPRGGDGSAVSLPAGLPAQLAQQVQALLRAGAPGQGGEGGAGTQGGGNVIVQDGPVRVQVTSAGRFGIAIPGAPQGLTFSGMGRVFEHLDYVSNQNGVVRQINPANCTVSLPIFLASPDVAVSQMDCGGTIVSFAQVAIGANTALYGVVVVQTKNPGCYYSYTDYDINNIPGGNVGVWDGAFEFTVTLGANTMKFSNLLADQTSWEQDEWDDLLLRLNARQSCGALPNAPPSHTGDWTGAFHWALPAGETVMLYYHSRTS